MRIIRKHGRPVFAAPAFTPTDVHHHLPAFEQAARTTRKPRQVHTLKRTANPPAPGRKTTPYPPSWGPKSLILDIL